MRQKLSIFLVLLLSMSVSARIGPINLEDLVERSDLVVVVDVVEVQAPTEKERVASFESIRVLKGSLQQGHQLYRGNRRICAGPNYRPGRYLLFLGQEGGDFVAAHHAYSVFEVKNNKLDWFVEENSPQRRESTLEKAEADIEEVLGKARSSRE